MLRRRILNLGLSPGTRLDEDELIADLGVGRTPLREAVARLRHEGLVVVLPRRATIVAPLDLDDLHQLIEARIVLETEVAALAACRAGPEAAARFREAVKLAARAGAAGDTDAYLEADRRFHDAVAAACGNVHLAEADRHINMLSMRFWHLGFRFAGPPAAPDHHSRLLAAIVAGDGDAARRLTVEHVENFRARLRGAL